MTAVSRLTAITLLAGACAASAQTVPSLMNYQGKLVDAAGNPMPNGSYDVLFRVSKKANPVDPADALVWGQTNAVTVINGIFNVVLGSPSGIILGASKTNLVDAFDEAQRYLSLTIVRNPSGTVANPAEILPRQQMLSAPYALKTAVATDAVNAYNGVPPGSILPFGGNNVPSGFILCNGAAVSRNTFSNLFSAIGTAWGTGDGFNTFNLPDLQGVFLRGVSNTSTTDPDKNTRTPSRPGGNAGNQVGSQQGDRMASHTHEVDDNFGAAHVISSGRKYAEAETISPVTHPTSTQSANLSNTETRPRNVYVNYIIKL